jgi:ATP-dependent helicase/nuclease subunit B
MNDISNRLLVFPTSRSIREYIISQKDSNKILSKTISIGDLFSNIVINETKTMISSDLRILYLREVITQINIKELGLSTNFAKFYKQSEYIFKFFNELNSEYKTISDLNDADTYAFYLKHLDILKEIYNKYVLILQKNNHIDSSTISNDYIINKDYISEYESVIINYEGYFSTFEFQVIKELSLYTNVIINVNINEFNQKNISMFKSVGLELKLHNSYNINLSKKVINYVETYFNELNNHEIYPVNQRIHQVYFIKNSIVNMIKNGIDAQKIVVILPDEKFASYLKLFDNEKYFNFAMGNDIKLSNTYITANAINNLLNKNEPKDSNRIEYLEINLDFIKNNIQNNWTKKVQKDILFKIIDFIYFKETNEDIVEQVLQIKLSLELLLFSNDMNYSFTYDITLQDAFKIFLHKIHEISLDDIHAGKITVIGILETRDIQYDGVIVVDFNDDIIPKRSIKDKFISTTVKQNTGLPTLKDRENLQKYYYKKLFDNAKSINISYVEDTQSSISRFASQLFTKINIIRADFSKMMQIKNKIKLFDEDIYMDINLSLNEWSATSLKTYLQCKRKYYLHYILQLKEHNYELKPASYEVGQILHNILEKVYTNNNITYENIQNEITKYQNKNPYLNLELEIWKRKLEKFVKTEEHRLKNSKIQIYALEMPFKIQYKGITIKGVIDRIDKLSDKTYSILDYKTSSNLKIDTSKNIDKTTDFQLEFYALARRDLNLSEVAYYDLNDGSIKVEVLLDEKIKILDNIFKSLETKKVNFLKCEDKTICRYCTYKIICGEDS